MSQERLPRKPKSEWKETEGTSKKVTVITYPISGRPSKEVVEITLHRKIYLEDTLQWCECPVDQQPDTVASTHYVEEASEVHGWVCNYCGGVTQLG